MIARLSYTDFDGENFLNSLEDDSNLTDGMVEKFAPNVVEGIKKLSNWAKKI